MESLGFYCFIDTNYPAIVFFFSLRMSGSLALDCLLSLSNFIIQGVVKKRVILSKVRVVYMVNILLAMGVKSAARDKCRLQW